MNYIFRSRAGAIRTWPAICAVAVAGATFGLTPARAQSGMSYEVWSKVFAAVNNMASWKAPGTTVGGTAAQASAAGASRTFTAAAGGVRLAESGAVALTLKNGVYVPLVATRAITAAAIGRGVGMALGGPLGIAVLAAQTLPSLIDWINQDKGQQIRLGPNYVEVKDGGGWEFQFQYGNEVSQWGSGNSGCTWWGGKKAADNTWATYSAFTFEGSGGGGVCKADEFERGQYRGQVYTNPSNARESVLRWRTATPDDLGSILPNYLMPIDLAPQGLEKGATYDATNISINGPASIDVGAPLKTTENLQVPAESNSTQTRSGNPFNLSPNTPTVTGQSTGSSQITSGGETINVPNRTTTTSTYNPTTNQTTTQTNIKSDPISKQTESTDKGSLTYTPTEATAKITNITTTTIINNTTNTVINSSIKTTDNKPADPKTDEEKSDLCKDNPDILACQTLDTPEGTIPKTNKNISYTEESVFGFGSCPADRFLTLHSTGQTLKVTDWARSCDAIATYYRPLLLAMAAFVAWMILVPGKGAV